MSDHKDSHHAMDPEKDAHHDHHQHQITVTGKEDGVLHNEHLAAIMAMSPEERALAEKKLLRKIDMRLVPWMTLLYLMSFLDRKFCHAMMGAKKK